MFVVSADCQKRQDSTPGLQQVQGVAERLQRNLQLALALNC